MYDWLSPAMFPGADEKVLPVFRFPQTGGMCGGRADRNTEVQYKVVNRCAQCVSSCSVPLVALFMAAFSSSTLALPQVSTVKVNGLSSFAYLQLHVRGVSKLFSSQWVFVSKL